MNSAVMWSKMEGIHMNMHHFADEAYSEAAIDRKLRQGLGAAQQPLHCVALMTRLFRSLKPRTFSFPLLRRWLFWLLAVLFLWAVSSHLPEIDSLVVTLAQGRWSWLLTAAGLQFIHYGIYTLVYKLAFDMVGVIRPVSQLLPVSFAAIFVNSTTPGGGAAGVALFIDDARRRGYSTARAATGVLLASVAYTGAFSLILAAGLGWLVLYHDLKIYELVAASLLFLLFCSLTAALTLGLWRPDWLQRLLYQMQRFVNCLGGWFRHPALLPESWSTQNAAEFASAAQALTAQPGKLALMIGAALAAQGINLLCLAALFQAFRQPTSLGILVAGYAMSMLFTMVAPTPSGIGVVEGLSPVIFASLGIPAATATVISLAFRGLAFWLPLVTGFVMLRRLSLFSSTERAHAQAEQPHIAAIITALMGIVNVLSGATPALAERMAILARFSPLAVRQGSHLTSVLAGFALLLLAHGLWRRKRTAWWLVLAILALSVVAHLLKGFDYEEASLAASLAIYLWTQRSHFNALSDAPSIQQGGRVLVAAFIFTLIYGVLGFYLLDRHFTVNFNLAAALRQTVTMFTQFYDPGLEPLTGFGRYFATSIYLIGTATIGYGLLMVLRPVTLRRPASAAEIERATAIVERHGRSSLARFTLLPDKAYYFSSAGSVIGYVARGSTAVVLGDPIGPPEDAAAAITSFRDFCVRNGWQAAFYQTLPDYLEQYRAAGFDTLCIGHEGIVDLNEFSLEGSPNKPLRRAVHRLTKLGYQATLHQPPLTDPLLNELRAISDEWLTLRHGAEQRFSLGWFDDEYMHNSLVMAVHAPTGMITAFANLVPEYQRNESTIDLMRHRQEIEHGTMEFLFVSLMQWAKEQGYASFNLGLSGLAGIGEHADDPAVERVLHFLYEHVNQFYNFKGLHEFKQKFHPNWSPRYLVYPGPASLLAVVVALERISSGDNFVVSQLKDWWGKSFSKAELPSGTLCLD
jgi:phosphatidylglycerol lysyltransferase